MLSYRPHAVKLLDWFHRRHHKDLGPYTTGGHYKDLRLAPFFTHTYIGQARPITLSVAKYTTRTDFAPGSSRPIAFHFPTESQPWAQRHVASTQRHSFISLHTSDSFRDMDNPTPNECHFFALNSPSSSPRQNASKPEHGSISLVPSAKTNLPDHVCVGRLTA